MNFKYISILLLGLFLTSCDLDITNPNAATDSDVLNSKDGLFALAVGIRQNYSTSALGNALLVPSVTTRETAIMTTFANLEELEEGGSKLSGENGYTTRLFSGLMRAKGMSEDLINSVDNVQLAAGTKSALLAYGRIYRAICLEQLANNFTQVAITNSLNNDATYSDRMEAYREAISMLTASVADLKANAASDEFASKVSTMDLLNTAQALLARNLLFVGDYDKAIAAANEVDPSSVSYFTFDDLNQNPVFLGMFDGTISYAPRASFGLPAGMEVSSSDGRTEFFMTAVDSMSLNGLPINIMASPFFATSDGAIPVYRPGEMHLIKAEAYARLDNTSAGAQALNDLIYTTAESSPIGLGAGLTEGVDLAIGKDALLNEIYKNRRIELFLSGMSLEDSRRFNRPQPPTGTDFSAERSRNFYPYPLSERQNNPNTPSNPEI